LRGGEGEGVAGVEKARGWEGESGARGEGLREGRGRRKRGTRQQRLMSCVCTLAPRASRSSSTSCSKAVHMARSSSVVRLPEWEALYFLKTSEAMSRLAPVKDIPSTPPNDSERVGAPPSETARGLCDAALAFAAAARGACGGGSHVTLRVTVFQ
jgi:hypothetical protein